MPTPLTPTEKRMLDLLGDGEPHSRHELQGLLWDDMASLATVRYHICKLRAKMTDGRDIVCVLRGRQICYQQVILLRT